MRTKIHNPEKVNRKYLPEGYRFLNTNEIQCNGPLLESIMTNIGFGKSLTWASNFQGNCPKLTYITKLTPKQLLTKREAYAKINP